MTQGQSKMWLLLNIMDQIHTGLRISYYGVKSGPLCFVLLQNPSLYPIKYLLGTYRSLAMEYNYEGHRDFEF